MSELDFSGFSQRKALGEILEIPPRVESVYSLTQHVWAGTSDSERRESKRQNRVRLDLSSAWALYNFKRWKNSGLTP